MSFKHHKPASTFSLASGALSLCRQVHSMAEVNRDVSAKGEGGSRALIIVVTLSEVGGTKLKIKKLLSG